MALGIECCANDVSLQDLSGRDHSEYDCVIVALLTHGIAGRLYSTDGDLIPIEDITKYLPDPNTTCPCTLMT